MPNEDMMLIAVNNVGGICRFLFTCKIHIYSRDNKQVILSDNPEPLVHKSPSRAFILKSAWFVYLCLFP